MSASQIVYTQIIMVRDMHWKLNLMCNYNFNVDIQNALLNRVTTWVF